MQAELIGTTVTSAQAFEKLGIVGIMFIVIFGLIYALGARKKQEEKFTNALDRIANASEVQSENMREMNSFYKDVISRSLETNKLALDDIKNHVVATQTAQQQCLQICNRKNN